MTLPDLSISDFLDAARESVSGQADENADFVRGSDYEALAGPCAILWSRESQRDTDLFRAVRFNTAVGDDLTNLVLKRYGIQRILDARGTGWATLMRPTAGTAGKIWSGTHMTYLGPTEVVYRTTEDVSYGIEDIQIRVPIEALKFGLGSKADETSHQALRLDDLVSDPTWFVSTLRCDDGTVFESADDLRARVRKNRFDSRVGQKTRIIQACQDAGATYVVVFRSDYGGDSKDFGLNFVYVGDPGYTASDSLLRACKVALRKARVLGDHMQVLSLGQVAVDFSIDITLNDAPGKFDTARLYQLHKAALAQYLSGSNSGFSYSLLGLAGAIIRQSPEVQGISFLTPSADTTILDNTGNFPAVLNRYVLGDVSIRYHAP